MPICNDPHCGHCGVKEVEPHVHPCPVCNAHVPCSEDCNLLSPEQWNRNGQRLAMHVVCDGCESEVSS